MPNDLKDTKIKKIINWYYIKIAAIFLLTIEVIIAATFLQFFAILRKDINIDNDFIFIFVFCTFCILFLYFFYLVYRKIKIKNIAAMSFCLSLSFILNIFLLHISIYLMPICMISLIMYSFSKKIDVFVSNVIFILLLIINFYFLKEPYSGTIVIMQLTIGLLSGTFVAFMISDNTKRLAYISRGFIICFLYILAIIFTHFYVYKSLNTHVLVFLPVALIINLVLGLFLQPFIEVVFNVLTSLRLVELTDQNAPLIKQLFTQALGTYYHSVAVATYAELCANAIHENVYLARAAAYYHDVGKILNAEYFKENQSGANLHDNLLPEVSADIIRKHSLDGYKLCKKYHIPNEIAEITTQHHGNLPMYIFYNKAKSMTDGEVDIEDYCYHLDRPISKIAAIIMICDASEAAIRSMDKPDGKKVEELVQKLIDERIKSEQFVNCDITLGDLQLIKLTIVKAFGGVYHNRIKYEGI